MWNIIKRYQKSLIGNNDLLKGKWVILKRKIRSN